MVMQLDIHTLAGPTRGRSLAREVFETVRLAVPVAMGQLGFVLMSVVDTAMVGPLGPESLAAVALGSALYFLPSIFLIGIVLAVEPIVAQRFGAKDAQGVERALLDGWWVALITGIIGTVLVVLFSAHTDLVGTQPELQEMTGQYLALRALGMTPWLLFIAYKSFLEGQGNTVPALVVLVVGNVVNAVGNWVLVYGRLGAPALGVVGSGIATTAASFFCVIVLGIYVRRVYPATRIRRPHWRGIRNILSVGLPIGLHQGFEVGIFALAAILMNRFGAVATAAHQIAIQLASMSFMVAVGCAVAASARVGQALGRGEPDAAERAGWVAIAVGVGYMSCSAIFFMTQGEWLVRLFVNAEDVAVVTLGAALLKIAAAFQLSDGTQAVTSGALRGAGDTKFALLCSLTGYWIVGLPLCLLLAFGLDWGPAGLWWALTAALTATAFGLLLRFRSGGWKRLARL